MLTHNARGRYFGCCVDISQLPVDSIVPVCRDVAIVMVASYHLRIVTDDYMLVMVPEHKTMHPI